MAAERITDEQNTENRRELEGLRALTKQPGWPYLLRLVEQTRNERADGLAQVGIDPVKRAEHVHGYHDAKLFPKKVIGRIEYLEAEMKRFTAGK